MSRDSVRCPLFLTSPILCRVGGGSRSGAAPPAIQQQRLPSQQHYLPLPIATHIPYVCFYIRTWVLAGKISVGCSRHKRPRHLKSCVRDTDPSGQNWSDILCRDDMSPTCWQHFRLSLPDAMFCHKLGHFIDGEKIRNYLFDTNFKYTMINIVAPTLILLRMTVVLERIKNFLMVLTLIETRPT